MVVEFPRYPVLKQLHLRCLCELASKDCQVNESHLQLMDRFIYSVELSAMETFTDEFDELQSVYVSLFQK